MAKTKVSHLLFVGGARDGSWCDVPDHVESMQVAPQQFVEEFIYPVDIKDGDQHSPVHIVEEYTRRGVTVDDDDISYFALKGLSDADVLHQLMGQYVGEPVVHGNPPKEILERLERQRLIEAEADND